MPNTITHIYFGMEVQKALPAEIKKICSDNIDAFKYGTIGPDFLFALREIGDPAQRYTNIMQACRVYPTFQAIAKRLSTVKDAVEISYTMGLLCHYVLDFNLHPYVNYFVEEGFIMDVPMLSKPHTHGLIEGAFDEYIATECLKDPKYGPWADLKTSAAAKEGIANLYYNAVNDVVGLDVSKSKIKLAIRITRLFSRIATDKSGRKHKIFNFVEEKIWKARKLTVVMRPPYGYGKLDYLNFGHKPFRLIRDYPETSTMSFVEMLDKSKEIALDYIANFYKAIQTDGDLEPMGGYQAFKVSYEGVTNVEP